MSPTETLSRVLAAAVRELPRETLPDVAALIEAAKVNILTRLVREAVPLPPEPAALVEPAEMARRLTVAETWVRDAARRQKIPAVYAGVHLRFDPAAVLAAMKAGTAALPDRSALSARGKKAAGHRIQRPAKPSNSAKLQGAATGLLPRDGGQP